MRDSGIEIFQVRLQWLHGKRHKYGAPDRS